MKLVLILSIVILCGCGDRTRLNPGAQYGWYVADSAWMFDHIPPGVQRTVSTKLKGYYDPKTGDMVMSEQLRGYELVDVCLEELAHAFDHQKPATLWQLIRRYQTPQRPDFLRIGHSEQELAREIARMASLPPPDPQAEPSR